MILKNKPFFIFISQVFGAFLSTDVIERRKYESEGLTYFGTGECFVFTVRRKCASVFYPNSAFALVQCIFNLSSTCREK